MFKKIGNRQPNKVCLKINNLTIKAELLDTEENRQLGLMYRQNMNENEGALFKFPRNEYLSFWMKNTELPLSILFIKDEKVIDIQNMIPFSVQSYTSPIPVCYALELLQDTVKKYNISPGCSIIKI